MGNQKTESTFTLYKQPTMKQFLNQQFSKTVAVDMTNADFFICIGIILFIFVVAGAVVKFSNLKAEKHANRNRLNVG